MALDGKAQAALALHRFGLGPRAGGIAAIASDPRGALLAELEQPEAGRIADAGLPSSAEAARVAHRFNLEQRAAQLAKRAEAGAAEMAPQAPAPDPGPPPQQRIFLADFKARCDAAIGAEIGFVERLVWFWSNHFCVSVEKGEVRPLCGAYEREAIRPHVRGTFSEMLLAAESHPAMLRYLDNAGSVGPNSMAGVRRKRGLNENLAREILELHTLGVRTGYSQDDVSRFAEVITGWTIVPPGLDPEKGGDFHFNPNMHEPGGRAVAGKTYDQAGVEQGKAVLSDLAGHPATARHVATKLVRHFVADVPPQALVEKLARRFLDTAGDLKEMAVTLVTAPEAWDAPRTKLKKPGEWVMAAIRFTALPVPDIRSIIQMQTLLGEPPWAPPAPKGFPDESAAWTDGIAQRIDIANQIAHRAGDHGGDPDALVDTALGPLASRDTRLTVSRAESRQQALALLLMAPEFQRR